MSAFKLVVERNVYYGDIDCCLVFVLQNSTASTSLIADCKSKYMGTLVPHSETSCYYSGSVKYLQYVW